MSSNRDVLSITKRSYPKNYLLFAGPLAHACAWHHRFFTVSQHMIHNRALKSLSVASPSETLAWVTTHLTAEQLDRLRRCAKGISLRFESSEIVDALVAGGYAEKGLAGVVTVTAKGQQYLRTHVS